MSVLEPLNPEEKEIAAKLVHNLSKFYVGKSKAKMGHEIVSGLKAKGHEKFSDIRLRKCINWLRRKGYPICSDPGNGYWWPETEQEVRDCISVNTERARGIMAANAGMEKGLKKYFPKLTSN